MFPRKIRNILLLALIFLVVIDFFSLGLMINYFTLGPVFIYIICTIFIGNFLIKKGIDKNDKRDLNNFTNSFAMFSGAGVGGNKIHYLIAGVLFLFPGVISDIVAFLILIPFVRKIIQIYLINKIILKQISSFMSFQMGQGMNFEEIFKNFNNKNFSSNESLGDSKEDSTAPSSRNKKSYSKRKEKVYDAEYEDIQK
ncbi:MAG: FxsA family protein [Succinivibrionaceae bacterium]